MWFPCFLQVFRVNCSYNKYFQARKCFKAIPTFARGFWSQYQTHFSYSFHVEFLFWMNLTTLRIPRTLQWKGPWTCITGVFRSSKWRHFWGSQLILRALQQSIPQKKPSFMNEILRNTQNSGIHPDKKQNNKKNIGPMGLVWLSTLSIW